MFENTVGYMAALKDFEEARRRAALEAIMARLTGRPYDLLSYEDVRQKLKARGSASRGLHDIPIDAIVGSVGRYTDFTRSFLPRTTTNPQRWARVKAIVTGTEGLPPIDVYKIGEAYFVKDGHHRVSVAHEMGSKYIQAYVTEVQTKVPLSRDDDPNDVILKAEYADFLDRTQLDQLRPGANLIVTAPGEYETIEEHIQVHHYYMGLEQQRDIPYQEAVAHWYDTVYMPVVEVIKEQGILRDFPDRTEADLYLWISEHRTALEERLGWEIRPEVAATHLVAHVSPRPQRVVARMGERILQAVMPDELESGRSPGEWRRERSASAHNGQLFLDILVPIGGHEGCWHALEQALEIARRDGGRLRGLHVVPSPAEAESEQARAIQDEFDRRCRAAGIPGTLVIEAGNIAHQICERNRWTDLMVLNLAYPPPSSPLAKLGSGFRTLLRRCASPVLAVPGDASPLNRALLAYDGSPKAEEALFVATYLAGRWGTSLDVVSVDEATLAAPESLARAQAYLESHGVQATYTSTGGSVPEAILTTAEEQESDFIIIGSYGHHPVREIVLGSVVDHVLQVSRRPTLICR